MRRALVFLAAAAVVYLPGMATAGALSPTVAVTATPSAISPNGDGTQDQTQIDVTLDQPANLSIEIRDDSAAVVKILVPVAPAPAGITTVTWKGDAAGSGTVPDGSYTAVASADNGGGPVEASTGITVDTVAPQLDWKGISPEPVRSTNPVHFDFQTHDPGTTTPLEDSFTVYDHAGDLETQDATKPEGSTTLQWIPKYNGGTPVLDGLYYVRIRVTDAAGNTTTGIREPFRVLMPTQSKTFFSLSGVGDRMALSFDDCNDAGAWAKILRILRDKNVTTTFFCLGENVARYPKLARETVADGNTIGNHSWSHPDMTKLGYSAIRSQLDRTTDIWWKVAATTPAPYFRPPYGAFDSTVVRAAGDSGYPRTMLWDVDPRDWEQPGAAEIVNRVVPHAHHGAIVVMHVQDQTAQALPQIINGIRKHHLEPVSLTDLFDAAGYRTAEPPADAAGAAVGQSAALFSE